MLLSVHSVISKHGSGERLNASLDCKMRIAWGCVSLWLFVCRQGECISSCTLSDLPLINRPPLAAGKLISNFMNKSMKRLPVCVSAICHFNYALGSNQICAGSTRCPIQRQAFVLKVLEWQWIDLGADLFNPFATQLKFQMATVLGPLFIFSEISPLCIIIKAQMFCESF